MSERFAMAMGRMGVQAILPAGEMAKKESKESSACVLLVTWRFCLQMQEGC